jgi:hypothetical protein
MMTISLSSKNPCDRNKVSVTERRLLVAPGQSKKLAAIRNKFQTSVPVETCCVSKVQALTGLKPEVATELNQARQLIDTRITEIMCSFPEGKKNRLFAFKFGSVAALKARPIKNTFIALGLDDHAIKMKLLADLDWHGNKVVGFKAA